MTWSDHLTESAFTPAPGGGYIFHTPSTRPFGPPSFYRVNEAEKAELIAIRRASSARWDPLFKYVLTALVLALTAAAVVSFAFLGVLVGIACIAGAVVAVAASIATLRAAKMRAIAPVLARLTPSTVTIPRAELIERESEAMRRGLLSEGYAAGTPLGSWFEDGNATGTSGFVQAMLVTQTRINVRIESVVARGIYWFGVLAELGFCGLVAGATVQSGYLLLMPAGLVIALVIYFFCWAWRWLWTGRTDHLFGADRHTPSGRLDEMRKNITSLLAFW